VPHTFIDAIHVQRCGVSRPPALFKGTFYPDTQYDPYARAARTRIAVQLPSLDICALQRELDDLCKMERFPAGTLSNLLAAAEAVGDDQVIGRG